MINKWILDNFKSIESREELEFRPLTIFTGANSSGKSTILQSVLLVSQTMQSSIVSRSIVLNGGIKKFGSYSDIVNQRDYKKDLTVGFEISEIDMSHKKYGGPWVDSVDSLKCNFSVSAKKDEDLQPFLKHLYLYCTDGSGKDAELSMSRLNTPAEDVLAISKTMKNPPTKEELMYKSMIRVSDDFTHVRFDGDPFANSVGATFTHFLPEMIVSFFNKYERIAEYVNDRFHRGFHPRIWNRFEEEDSTLLRGIFEEKMEYLKKHVTNSSFSLTEIDDLNKEIESAWDLFVRRGRMDSFLDLIDLCKLTVDEKDEILKSIIDEILNLPPYYETSRIPAQFIPGIDLIKEYFSEHIWYLGPLREEPKAIYPLESDGSMTDVGYRGENAAAVFDFNRTRKIDNISPSVFDDLSDVRMKKKRTTFEKAIKEWLVYLDVASDIDSDDRGKIGHTMQISTDLEIKQDLTHVGVGVSQVLPILVTTLLAEPGDIIILEQPELHLHPKVQTRLADFFVAMNALGKQCLIETHSEYLINRLRYFVATSNTSKVADDTMIYFVEKEGGHSKYRPVTINKYGVIEEWPDGFFDESSKIAEAILEAGMKKRMEELGIED